MAHHAGLAGLPAAVRVHFDVKSLHVVGKG